LTHRSLNIPKRTSPTFELATPDIEAALRDLTPWASTD
jgi:hypothetical protein